MKIQFLTLLLSFTLTKGIAQNVKISLYFHIENILPSADKLRVVTVTVNGEEIKLNVDDTGFFIPDSLFKRKANLRIKANGKQYQFSNIVLNWQPAYPKWILSVDYQPISKTHKYLIVNVRRKVRWLYTLDKGTGSLITEYRFSKP
ncbi:hypothetical protein [Fibrella aquatilis]|uniref:Uncharacterized protein n=1 Tax=Fibrella aquatilis TaxID=2817059 RepID=A0A939G907_9BACT|nr:hypothetical protein [Fibrella aquatilis]MBO0932028.1 hypothetical protein [Fibrella aquatilis]